MNTLFGMGCDPSQALTWSDLRTPHRTMSCSCDDNPRNFGLEACSCVELLNKANPASVIRQLLSQGLWTQLRTVNATENECTLLLSLLLHMVRSPGFFKSSAPGLSSHPSYAGNSPETCGTGRLTFLGHVLPS